MPETRQQATDSLRGRRLRVHYNLHRKDFSVVDQQSARVIANVADITLSRVSFHVQPRCLERIRQSGQRAVCAYAIGLVQGVATGPDVTGWTEITFNPRRAGTFTTRDGQPVSSSGWVVFRDAHGYSPAAPSSALERLPGTGHDLKPDGPYRYPGREAQVTSCGRARGDTATTTSKGADMTSDAITIPSRVTPQLLTAYLTALGLEARLERHAACPGSQPLPTVTLPDGTVVVIGNAGHDNGEADGKPMSKRLHAQRHTPVPGWFPAVPDFNSAVAIFEGTPAEVGAEVLRWAGTAGHVGDYSVEVQMTFSVQVPVTAASAEKAADLVNRNDFGLPGIDEWHRHKGWLLRVFDHDGAEAYEIER